MYVRTDIPEWHIDVTGHEIVIMCQIKCQTSSEQMAFNRYRSLYGGGIITAFIQIKNDYGNGI